MDNELWQRKVRQVMHDIEEAQVQLRSAFAVLEYQLLDEKVKK